MPEAAPFSRACSCAAIAKKTSLTTVIPADSSYFRAAAKPVPRARDIGERFRRMSLDAEQEVSPNLQRNHRRWHDRVRAFRHSFHRCLHRRRAQRCRAFLAALTAEQRSKTLYPVDDPEWRKWMNQHFYVRQGVSFQEMTDKQRECGVRSAARRAERARLQTDARHHAAQRDAGGADQRLRFPGRMALSHHRDGQAVRQPSRGDGSSTAITPSSITSCWAIRW